MRISNRLALAGSIVVMLTAGAVVALSMPESATNSVVPAPEVAVAAESQAAGAGEPQDAGAVEPQEAHAVEVGRQVAPPITGAQIAELAATPARERAAELIARAKAEAEAERARRDDDDDDSQAERWADLRDEIREACDDGRIRGSICRNA